MKKILLLFALMTLSTGVWANTITYTATEGLGGLPDNFFDLAVQTHSYNSNTHTGTITFSGDVTEIKDGAFQEVKVLTSITLPNTITKIGERAFCRTGLKSITIPNSVTRIGEYVFSGCESLTTIEFEGSACQNGIDDAAFGGIEKEEPLILILPDDWEIDNLPLNSETKWHDGYFTSERTFDQYRQAALKVIDDALGDDAESDIFQDLKDYYNSAIGGANKCKIIDVVKDAVLAMLPIIKSTYTSGKTDGIADGKAEAFGEMGEKCIDCPAVKVIKGDKIIMLYNPDRVNFIKVSEGE